MMPKRKWCEAWRFFCSDGSPENARMVTQEMFVGTNEANPIRSSVADQNTLFPTERRRTR
jgi:hypothetical protein